ncbi:MAG: DUF4123 domain-containing protein [Desulfuromonadaceae bacterium]|nr:DUF4123 domain-containing protein [Desulfuromonadaceae bacterium]
MADEKTVQSLKMNLFSEIGAKVFAILDGASVPSLIPNLATFEPEYICLYRGELEPDMAEVAPYLVILERESDFTKWLLSNGWGEHWGIFGVTQADLPTLRKHFRKFLMVYDESGKSLYFRYYDPRVLRVYLPTCNAGELKTVFGPVLSYLVEDEEVKVGRKFVFVGNGLVEDRVVVG